MFFKWLPAKIILLVDALTKVSDTATLKVRKVFFRFQGHCTLRKVSEGLSFSLRLKMASDETTQMMMINGY
jgi:hypothetical protein